MAHNQQENQGGELFNRILFHTRYQEESESVEDFAASLKELLRACHYKADCVLLDSLARDRFIAGIADKELQAFITTQPTDITLDTVVQICVNLLESSLVKKECQETNPNYNTEAHEQLLDDPEGTDNAFAIKFDNMHSESMLDEPCSLMDNEDGQLDRIKKQRKCCYCTYETDEKSTLEKHMIALHNPDKVFKCEKCDFSTGWKCSLRKHLIKVHNESNSCTYTCEVCGFSTKSSRAYQNHLMALKISGKCDILDPQCTSDKSGQHSTSSEPLKCPHCNYTRAQRSKILNHIKSVHEDAKPYRCMQCKSSFKLKFRLTAHMKLSHGDGKVKIFWFLNIH